MYGSLKTTVVVTPAQPVAYFHCTPPQESGLILSTITMFVCPLQVWFQLGNTLFPGGHAPISSQALTPDEGLQQDVAAWKAANTPAQ